MFVSLKSVFFAAVAAGVGAPGLHAQLTKIPTPRLATIHAVTSSDFMVAGEVAARTDIDFTIRLRGSELRTARVTEDTAMVKGGVTIQLSDLVVGDKVQATLMRGGDGKLRAVNVTVRVGSDSGL